MKILLPSPNFKLSAKILSNEDLETQEENIRKALRCLHQTPDADESLWDDPYVLMWLGHELQLAEFGLVCFEELKSRNLAGAVTEDELYVHMQAASSGSPDKPDWWGRVDLHISHKAALLRQDYAYYQPFFASYVSQDLEMVWPV
jgi:hypothetical protein